MIKIQLVNSRRCRHPKSLHFSSRPKTPHLKNFFSFLKNKYKVVNFFKLTFTTFKTSLYKIHLYFDSYKKRKEREKERKKDTHTHTQTHTHSGKQNKKDSRKNASIMRHISNTEK